MVARTLLMHTRRKGTHTKESTMLLFVAWIILAILSLPIAILALVLYPVVWLLALPFRLVGVSVSAVFDLIGAIIRLPVRLLRGNPV
jgi:hypothetical protein